MICGLQHVAGTMHSDPAFSFTEDKARLTMFLFISALCYHQDYGLRSE